MPLTVFILFLWGQNGKSQQQKNQIAHSSSIISHFNLIMWPVQRTHRHTQMHAHSAGLWVKTETQKLNHIILHQIIKYTILGWSKSSTDTKEKNRERKV